MHAHEKKLVVGERAGFVQDAFGDKDFADVVDPRGIDEVGGFLRRKVKSAGQNFRIARDQVAMA